MERYWYQEMVIREIKTEVISNKQVSEDFILMKLTNKTKTAVKPGQFIEILCRKPDNPDPYIRRPFSIMSCNSKEISILYKVVGRGTEYIKNLSKDDKVSFLGFLGKGYNLIDNGNVLLIAGGTGIASLYFLAEKLKRTKIDFKILLGLKKSKDLPTFISKKFKKELNVIFEEEDGKVDKLINKKDVEKYKKIFICGPMKMIKTVIKKIKMPETDIEVSLEERMGCGFGVCYTCPVERLDGKGYYRVCKDGPVFNIKDIKI